MMRFGVVSLVVGVFFALALAGCKTDTHSQVQKPPSADANVETEQIVLQVEGLT